MRRLLAVAIVAVSFAVLTAARPLQAPAGQFSVVLDYTPLGWSANCEAGCGWRTVSFACERACNALVDAQGLVTLATERPSDPRFAFIVERTPDGVRAQSRSGAKWTSLSWGCEAQPCRARITDAGVTLVTR